MEGEDEFKFRSGEEARNSGCRIYLFIFGGFIFGGGRQSHKKIPEKMEAGMPRKDRK